MARPLPYGVIPFTTIMPKTTSSKSAGSTRRADAAGDTPASPSLADLADALYRAASESCRQHARYACVVEHDTLAVEQIAAAEAVELTDQLLESIVDKYERAAGELPRSPKDGWWHQANILWLASREWLRHRDAGDGMTRAIRRHGVDELEVLTVEFMLEGSALLALRQAAEAYVKARPEAEIRVAAWPGPSAARPAGRPASGASGTAP
jgi:hypothetical protein